MARRRAAARRRRKDAIGVVLILIVAGALAALAAAAMRMRAPALDEATLCRRDGAVPAHTLALVDATDKLDVRHVRRLEAIIARETARLPRYGKFTLAALANDPDHPPRILFSGCTPGDRSSVDPLWENVGRIEARKAEAFDAPLARALAFRQAAGAGSPIVEGLAAAALDRDFAGSAPDLKLVLISDLLHHRPQGFSLYDPKADLEAYRTSPHALRTPPDLRDVAVVVVMLERPNRAAAQDNARRRFWGPFLADSVAKSVTWE